MPKNTVQPKENKGSRRKKIKNRKQMQNGGSSLEFNEESGMSEESSGSVEEPNTTNDIGSENNQEKLVRTRIFKQGNPFVEFALTNGGDSHDKVNPDAKDSGSDDNEEQLLQPSKSNKNDRRRSSVATSKDSSPDVPYNTFHLNEGAPNKDCKNRAQILEASKISEGQGRTYVAYAIKYGNAIVKRRYSDFESLRKVLIKLFPMTLIPPIPEKQSLKSYGKAMAHSKSSYVLPTESGDSVDLCLSVINGPVTSNDEKLIRHRIRMLTSFLNRLLKNDEITKTSIIYDFLDPNNKNWNDLITSSLAISSLPKSVLQCNPIDPTNTTKAHTYLPIPSSANQLLSSSKEHTYPAVADEFTKIEGEYRTYEQLLHSGVYKYMRATTKELNYLRGDLKGISDQFAQFSIDETKNGSELAELLSHSSDAYGALYEHLEVLVGNLHYNISEPLSECAHMATAVRELLHYRRLKVIQKDILERTILYKQGQLKKYQQQESENKQIDSLVNTEMESSGVVNLENPSGPRTYTGKMMSKFNQFASIIKDSVSYQEQDPATAARSLEKEVKQLEESLAVATTDLDAISKTIKETELPRFTEERRDELVQIFKNYSRYMKENALKNLEVWKQLQQQLDDT